MSSLPRIASLLRRSLCAGTHNDFARVTKAIAGTARERISKQLEDKVVLYMKGSPSAPACGFSWKTVQILDAMEVSYKSYNVLEDEELRQGIKEVSSWPTIPQLYIGGELAGGCDIVEGMARNGELKTALQEAGAYDAATPAPPESPSA
jgi:monothiol glutaredoxin